MVKRFLGWRLAVVVVVAGLALAGTTVAFGGGSGANQNQGTPASGGAATRAVGDVRWVVCNGHLGIGVGCASPGRGRGVVRTVRLATGQYEAIFDINVRACDYVATVGSPFSSGTEPTGEITTVGRATDVRGVFLTTHNSAGAFSDRSWHLTVQC